MVVAVGGARGGGEGGREGGFVPFQDFELNGGETREA